jgi:hypothetical protein
MPSDVLSWTRTHPEERIVLVANLGDAASEVDLSGVTASGEVLASTGSRAGHVPLASLRLDALEGLLLRL